MRKKRMMTYGDLQEMQKRMESEAKELRKEIGISVKKMDVAQEAFDNQLEKLEEEFLETEEGKDLIGEIERCRLKLRGSVEKFKEFRRSCPMMEKNGKHDRHYAARRYLCEFCGEDLSEYGGGSHN